MCTTIWLLISCKKKQHISSPWDCIHQIKGELCLSCFIMRSSASNRMPDIWEVFNKYMPDEERERGGWGLREGSKGKREGGRRQEAEGREGSRGTFWCILVSAGPFAAPGCAGLRHPLWPSTYRLQTSSLQPSQPPFPQPDIMSFYKCYISTLMLNNILSLCDQSPICGCSLPIYLLFHFLF